jgi:hypothetical protein
MMARTPAPRKEGENGNGSDDVARDQELEAEQYRSSNVLAIWGVDVIRSGARSDVAEPLERSEHEAHDDHSYTSRIDRFPDRLHDVIEVHGSRNTLEALARTSTAYAGQSICRYPGRQVRCGLVNQWGGTARTARPWHRRACLRCDLYLHPIPRPV